MSSTFTYDYENRLTAISGGATASFVYDADGNRVKSTVGGVTTVYIAGMFEFIENGATDKITKYYEGNAMRSSGYGVDDGVFYLLQDHLNSSSVMVDQAGTTVATNYYYPYGSNRGGTAFSNLTTKRFTGQYHESSLPGGEGLSYYGARWYDAKLGRFLNADTIVPQPNDPQSLNRYSYVRNNPTSKIDPTGHYDLRPGDDPYWKNTSLPTSSITSQELFKQFWQYLKTQANSPVYPDLYIRGVGHNILVSQGGIEEVYDFSRNQFARFTFEGFGAGYDSGSVGVNIYAGRGWKNSLRADDIASAYAGGAMSLTGAVNAKTPLVPSPTASVSAFAITKTAWSPNFSGVVTFTWSLGKSADLRRDKDKFMPVDPHVSLVEYKLWGTPRTFDSDSDFIGFIWTNLAVSWPEKIDMTYQVLMIDEIQKP